MKTATEGTREEDRVEDAKLWDELDHKLGFPKFQEGPSRQGWLVNMKEVRRTAGRSSSSAARDADTLKRQTLVPDELKGSGRAGVDYYFIQDDGSMFKATLAYEPYFYIATRVSSLSVVRPPLHGADYDATLCRADTKARSKSGCCANTKT